MPRGARPAKIRPAALSDWLSARLDRQADEPIYRQLQRLLHDAVLSQQLPAGTKLPSSRLLAQELGIARNTVTDVYAHLAVAGYVSSQGGSGTYVADITPEGFGESGGTTAPDAAVSLPTLSLRGSALLQRAGVSSTQWGAFMPGVPDVTEFPARVWMRLSNRHWRRPAPELLTYAPGGGYGPLRKVLAEHLRTARGVRCEPHQIIMTTGAHQAIDLAARLLSDAGDRARIEEPSYWGIRSVLQSLGLRLEPTAVDTEGMILPREGEAPAVLTFLTPSHQYPLGMVMSLARRRAWLDHARQHGSWIVEDDYDSEFRYGTRPLECLQGLDAAGRVIYIGSFSKTLFPGLRIGYVVVPEALAPAFARGAAELYREGQLHQQAVLTDFIAEGHLASHIRRMRGLYGQRRARLKDAIAWRFGEALPVTGDDAGLHLVACLPGGVDDRVLVEAAGARGVAVRPLSSYYTTDAAQSGLLLGYACVPDAQIDAAFETLAEVLEPVLVAVT